MSPADAPPGALSWRIHLLLRARCVSVALLLWQLPVAVVRSRSDSDVSTCSDRLELRFDVHVDGLRSAIAILALASCALVFSFTTGTPSTNPMSRFATMDALVHDHAWIINRSVFAATADKVRIGERFYSSKPPMLSTVGAVIYKQLHLLTGLSFREDTALAVKVMNLLLGGLSHVALLLYAYWFLSHLRVSPHVMLWSYACFALGQLGLAYATTVNNHTPAEAAGFIAFCHAAGLRRGVLVKTWHWIAAGFAAGLAPTLDLGMLFVSAALGLYLLSWDWRKTLTRFVPASLPPMAAHFALTYMISGSWRPIYLRPELYRYPGSYWNAPTGIDALDEPRLTYLYNITLGHHGVLSMTPVLFFALWALGRAAIKKSTYRAEAWTVGASFLVMVAFYVWRTKNYGGLCVGFRWLLPATGLVLAFVPVWLTENRNRLGFVLFVLCLCVSQYHAFTGLVDPWQPSAWARWLSS